MMQHDTRPDARVLPRYEVDTLGAPFKVILIDSVTLGIDPKTGEETVQIPDLVGLINSVIRSRVCHTRKLSGDELKFLRNALGVKAKTMAEFLEVSPEHLSRCEAGAKVMSAAGEKLFRLAAFIGTSFSEPEEVFASSIDGDIIEQKAKKPRELAKRFIEIFFSMKIQSAFDPDEPLHFEFYREAGEKHAYGMVDGCMSDEEEEWKAPDPIAA